MTTPGPSSALLVVCAALMLLLPAAGAVSTIGMLIGATHGSCPLFWAALPLIVGSWLVGIFAWNAGGRCLRWWWTLPVFLVGATGLVLLLRTLIG